MDPREILTDEELKMLLSNESEPKAQAQEPEPNPILAPRSSKHPKKKSFWAALFNKNNK